MDRKRAEDLRDFAIRLALNHEFTREDLGELATELILLASCERITPRGICDAMFKALPDDETYRKSLDPPV